MVERLLRGLTAMFLWLAPKLFYRSVVRDDPVRAATRMLEYEAFLYLGTMLATGVGTGALTSVRVEMDMHPDLPTMAPHVAAMYAVLGASEAPVAPATPPSSHPHIVVVGRGWNGAQH